MKNMRKEFNKKYWDNNDFRRLWMFGVANILATSLLAGSLRRVLRT
ncbi:MAG: hypothetical protein WCV68_01710 [Candidatus Paceibacterota bacterium]|jgi:hypothetical protein